MRTAGGVDRRAEAGQDGDQCGIPLRMQPAGVTGVAAGRIMNEPPEPRVRPGEKINHPHRAIGPATADVLESDWGHRPEEVDVVPKLAQPFFVIERTRHADQDVEPGEQEPGIGVTHGRRQRMHGQVEPDRPFEHDPLPVAQFRGRGGHHHHGMAQASEPGIPLVKPDGERIVADHDVEVEIAPFVRCSTPVRSGQPDRKDPRVPPELRLDPGEQHITMLSEIDEEDGAILPFGIGHVPSSHELSSGTSSASKCVVLRVTTMRLCCSAVAAMKMSSTPVLSPRDRV